MIQDIRSGWTPAPRTWSPQRAATAPADSVSVAAVSASRDVSGSLSITTREGDTFSISASFDTTASYAGVRGPGVHAGAWSLSASREFSVQVEGSLDRQEMKDISRTVRTFLHDLRAMLKGHDVSVENVAAGQPKSLQSVSASASATTTFTAIAGIEKQAPPEQDTLPVGLPDSAPVA